MNVRRVLTALVRVVADEAERNPDFDTRLREALGLVDTSKKKSLNLGQPNSVGSKRPHNRRAPAALDPIQFARQGEAILRMELSRLNLEQLLDVVAEYGMDTGKLVMKWRTPDRVIDRIVEVSLSRAQKGNAFRDAPDATSS